MAHVMMRLAPILTAALALPLQAAGPLADPTRPPPGYGAGAQPAPPPPPLVVSSVFMSGRQAYAVVDGREVRVGDTLGEGRVTRIDEQGVWIRLREGVRQLPLLPGVRKTPAKKGMERTK